MEYHALAPLTGCRICLGKEERRFSRSSSQNGVSTTKSTPKIAMSHRRRPRGPSDHPNSHRWETTLTADLEKVAKQLEGSDCYDTGKRKKGLNDLKMANQKTSISFGNYKVGLDLCHT
jgi:hypothetical protein